MIDFRNRSGQYEHDTIRGENHHSNKLDEDRVLAIRHLYALGRTSQRELGLTYGVSQQCIGDILSGRTWSHIK